MAGPNSASGRGQGLVVDKSTWGRRISFDMARELRNESADRGCLAALFTVLSKGNS
jgi:hypothetical protein